MKLKKIVVSVMCLLALQATVEAKMKKSFELNGKKIEVGFEKIENNLELSRTGISQIDVIQIYFQYQRLLADGKIDEAAKLNLDPIEDAKMHKAYAERLGGMKAYQEKMEQVLQSHVQVSYVLELGTQKLLIGKHPEHGFGATFFRCADNKCIIDNKIDQLGNDDLVLLFGEIQNGKIKL
jgi:hypothetical protein